MLETRQQPSEHEPNDVDASNASDKVKAALPVQLTEHQEAMLKQLRAEYAQIEETVSFETSPRVLFDKLNLSGIDASDHDDVLFMVGTLVAYVQTPIMVDTIQDNRVRSNWRKGLAPELAEFAELNKVRINYTAKLSQTLYMFSEYFLTHEMYAGVRELLAAIRDRIKQVAHDAGESSLNTTSRVRQEYGVYENRQKILFVLEIDTMIREALRMMEQVKTPAALEADDTQNAPEPVTDAADPEGRDAAQEEEAPSKYAGVG